MLVTIILLIVKDLPKNILPRYGSLWVGISRLKLDFI